MANYWAIAIGINQYQSFQPLIYAQRDAQQFWDFMSQEGGFGDDHCLLMTDGTSAPDHITYPNRGNIQSRVLQVCQQILKPGDLLWVFFSGYGVRHEGKDYLMPVEGDPAKVAATGVAMESLYRILNTAPTDNVILTLDMNRSQSVLAGEGVGEQIVALAKQYGIATLLSCRPNQFSHETLALRQGLFTTALIEAMRYQGCVTLEQLVQYLGDRLPELSEHHWRPPQEPDAFIPPEKEYLLIVPEQAATNLGNRPPVNFAPSYAIATTSTLAAMTSTSGPSLPPILPLTAPNTSTALLDRPEIPDLQPRSTPLAPRESAQPAPATRAPARQPAPQSVAPPRHPKKSAVAAPVPAESDNWMDDPFLRKLLMWAGAIASVLLIGVLLRNGSTLTRPAPPTAPTNNPAETQNQANVITPTLLDSTSQTPIQVEANSPFSPAVAALSGQEYEVAKQQLDRLPADQQKGDTYQKLLEQVNLGLLAQARTMINRVREESSQNQASDFVEGIKKARQIRPNQPYFAEAQQDIDRWSRVILDMAQGRAGRNNSDTSVRAKAENFYGAIGSARLIPTDRPDLYNQAQQAIATWSQNILTLALNTAAEGNLDEAIATAELVPPNTPVYPDAQEAIAGWRNQNLPIPQPETPAETTSQSPDSQPSSEIFPLEPEPEPPATEESEPVPLGEPQ